MLRRPVPHQPLALSRLLLFRNVHLARSATCSTRRLVHQPLFVSQLPVPLLLRSIVASSWAVCSTRRLVHQPLLPAKQQSLWHHHKLQPNIDSTIELIKLHKHPGKLLGCLCLFIMG